jgi:hypothetical protein
VSFKNYQKIFWINYKNKRRKLTDVFASLKEEGLTFGKNKIIQTLREDNLQNRRNRTHKPDPKNAYMGRKLSITQNK